MKNRILKSFKQRANTPKPTSSFQSNALLWMATPLSFVRKKIKSLYTWTVKWAAHPRANLALASVSFAESSFFPLPPDPLLLTMTFSRPKAWWRLAMIATIGSVIGGLFGYFIGFALFESIGGWLIQALHLQTGFATVEKLYVTQSFWAVFAAAFTPIPYKIFTIAAGVFAVNLPGFIIASLLGRGMRFFAVSGAAAVLGNKYKDQIERYVDLISLSLLGIAIVAFLLIKLI